MADKKQATVLVEEDAADRFVKSVKLKRTSKGSNIGLCAMLATIAAWGVIYYFTEPTGNVMADSILHGSILRPLNLAGIAAILSIFGYIGSDSSCMLISAAALTGIALYNTNAIILVVLPVVLLCITSVRFRDSLTLDVKTVKIETQQNTEA